MQKIGFIGLGIMGEMMAKRLLSKGYQLVVYNRTKEKLGKLKDGNFKAVDLPAQIWGECEIVISMLSDSTAVESVVYGNDGLLGSVKPGFIHIDMSTISPSTTKKLYLDYKNRSAHFVHAPVLGSRTQAGDGTLLIFAGGDEEAISKCEEIFKVLGRKLWRFDSVEKATNLKIAMNSMIAMMIIALSQAFVLAEKSGISKEVVLEVLENSALNSTMYQNKGKAIIEGNFTPNFYVKHILKDINLSLEIAQDMKIPMPVISAVRELYISALAKGYENEDYSAIYKVIAELAGLKI
ncbi:glyoxylate/succinic semialdehyde reductase [Candidatus Thermokryptus mobilis]|uniref:Glyoxylate/succinic semialdehyde reductase n=1 Tax=Candidatus Thermokryptus mobilis TaxID=1643428 RepID=A0A0S4N0D9_9BACT|nr:NAD(P)-dependent oxidoreductase [Candidatus Thermokryptus mobilis]CUU03309.1 glyoxylate/succinic semialdehyde reductase [Candidatus Thermokryptus mobilis]